jgi:hypothetical protein
VFAPGKSTLRSRAAKQEDQDRREQSHTYILLADFFSFSVIVKESAPGFAACARPPPEKWPQIVHKAITSEMMMNADGLCLPVFAAGGFSFEPLFQGSGIAVLQVRLRSDSSLHPWQSREGIGATPPFYRFKHDKYQGNHRQNTSIARRR